MRFDAATLGQWGWNGSAWALVPPRLLQASVTYDPPGLAAGEGVTTTVTVTGAALGDFARASFSLDLQGMTLTAWVSAAATVSVRFQNGTAGAVDLGSGTLRVPEAAPAMLNGTPLLTGALFGSGRREFATEVSWDLPSLAPGATALLDVTVNGARAGDLASASLVSSTRFIELDAAVWSNNTVRVMARNISAATFDLAAVTLSVGVTRRRVA